MSMQHLFKLNPNNHFQNHARNPGRAPCTAARGRPPVWCAGCAPAAAAWPAVASARTASPACTPGTPGSGTSGGASAARGWSRTCARTYETVAHVQAFCALAMSMSTRGWIWMLRPANMPAFGEAGHSMPQPHTGNPTAWPWQASVVHHGCSQRRWPHLRKPQLPSSNKDSRTRGKLQGQFLAYDLGYMVSYG